MTGTRRGSTRGRRSSTQDITPSRGESMRSPSRGPRAQRRKSQSGGPAGGGGGGWMGQFKWEDVRMYIGLCIFLAVLLYSCSKVIYKQKVSRKHHKWVSSEVGGGGIDLGRVDHQKRKESTHEKAQTKEVPLEQRKEGVPLDPPPIVPPPPASPFNMYRESNTRASNTGASNTEASGTDGGEQKPSESHPFVKLGMDYYNKWSSALMQTYKAVPEQDPSLGSFYSRMPDWVKGGIDYIWSVDFLLPMAFSLVPVFFVRTADVDGEIANNIHGRMLLVITFINISIFFFGPFDRVEKFMLSCALCLANSYIFPLSHKNEKNIAGLFNSVTAIIVSAAATIWNVLPYFRMYMEMEAGSSGYALHQRVRPSLPITA